MCSTTMWEARRCLSSSNTWHGGLPCVLTVQPTRVLVLSASCPLGKHMEAGRGSFYPFPQVPGVSGALT